MNALVIYSTHRGNTEKIAMAIAKAANCKAVKLTEDFDGSSLSLQGVDIVFLGTGIRGGEPYKELLKYLKTADLGSNKRFALFMTWGGGGASDKLTYQVTKKALEAKNQRLDSDFFICQGQTFGFALKGHPNKEDLENAQNWVFEKLNS